MWRAGGGRWRGFVRGGGGRRTMSLMRFIFEVGEGIRIGAGPEVEIELDSTGVDPSSGWWTFSEIIYIYVHYE